MARAQETDFEIYGRRPATWLEASRRHLAVYEILAKHLLDLTMRSGAPQDQVSGCFYSQYLHAGLAVENAVRAYQVAKDPTIVAGEAIDRKKLPSKGAHKFLAEAEKMLGSLSQAEIDLLDKLETAVGWAGKYTVPIVADFLYDWRAVNNFRNAPMSEPELIRSLVARLQAAALGIPLKSA